MKSMLLVSVSVVAIATGWWLFKEPPTAQMATIKEQPNNEQSIKDGLAERLQARSANHQRPSELERDIARFEQSRSVQRPKYESQRSAYKTAIDDQKSMASLRSGHSRDLNEARITSQSHIKTNPYLAYSLPELGKALDAKIVKVNGRLMLEKNRRLISDQEARHILYKISKQRSNS